MAPALFVVVGLGGHDRSRLDAAATEACQLVHKLRASPLRIRAAQEASFDLVGECPHDGDLLPGGDELKLFRQELFVDGAKGP